MQNHDENAWKTEVQYYLRAVIKGVNAENTEETYLACLRLRGYLAKEFSDLKTKEQVDSFLKNHRIDCGLEFKKIKFSVQFGEALNQLKQDFFEQESDKKMQGKVLDQEVQNIFQKTQQAIIGLDACIGMTIGDAYKDQSGLVEDERYTNQETQTVFNEEVSCISKDIAMDQVIHSLISKLSDYINFELPIIQKQSTLQKEKRLAVNEAISDLQDLKNDKRSPLLRAKQFENILGTLETKNQDAEKITNIFKKIVKAIFTGSLGNRLGQKTNNYKARITTLKQEAEAAEMSIKPDTSSNQNPSPSNR